MHINTFTTVHYWMKIRHSICQFKMQINTHSHSEKFSYHLNQTTHRVTLQSKFIIQNLDYHFQTDNLILVWRCRPDGLIVTGISQNIIMFDVCRSSTFIKWILPDCFVIFIRYLLSKNIDEIPAHPVDFVLWIVF